MHQAIKDAIMISKTIGRNGYDAYVINAPLQEQLIAAFINKKRQVVVDIACDADFEILSKLFPAITPKNEERAFAQLEENGFVFKFYPFVSEIAAHPEFSVMRQTPAMIGAVLDSELKPQIRFSKYGAPEVSNDKYEGFADVKDGPIRLLGLPDDTLRHNYLLAIRALRYAANYDVPIDPNTWMAIVRASVHILDYVPPRDIMAEWRKVAAESMHRFVQLLYDAQILQGLIPEVAGMVRVPQQNSKDAITENVFQHTLKCMRLYPEEGLHYDWLGTVAMLFHDVGKLFTAEFFDGRWTYYQHHRVGAKITSRILRRLHFDAADADLICYLIDHHMRFHFMMTDRGIRRFKSLGETPRLIAMSKADLLAREDSFTSFNHNMKYLERAEMPETLLEPLLNGNEIMSVTNLAPGRLVGVIRDELLKAQKSGQIVDREGAIAFARSYALSFNVDAGNES